MYQRNEFYEDVRRQAKAHLKGLYPPDRTGRGFICPLCGNGKGYDGDGISFVKADRQGNSNSDVLHCFKCGFSGDIIKLRATETGVSYFEAAKELAAQLGIHYDDQRFSSSPRRVFRRFKKLPPLPPLPEAEPVEQVDYSDFFADAAKNLEQTDYYKRRGLSLETCRHFNLGFVSAWNHPKVPNAPKSPRFIVPTSKFSYLARDVRKNLTDKQKKYSKQKVGSVSFFNIAALEKDIVFVVEGEFDAISFYELHYDAIALGSVSNVNKFINLLNTLTKRPKFFILALDNDEAGKKATEILQQSLKELNITCSVAPNIYGGHKDANEFLCFSKTDFQQNASAIFEKATAFLDSREKERVQMTPTETDSEHVVDAASATDTTTTVDEVTILVSTGNKKVDDAIAILNAITDFAPAVIFDKKILNAAAICEAYHPATFYPFRDRCKANKIKLSDFNKQISPFSKSVAKIKKREDKAEVDRLLRELAIKQREEMEQERIADFKLLETLSKQSPGAERNKQLIALISKNLARNRYGDPKGSSENFELILKYDPYISGCIGYDNFSHKMVVRRSLPWDNPLFRKTHASWSNFDDSALANYISRTYDSLDNFNTLLRVLNEYALAHSFNPVQEYLESLPEWDGQPRADSFFIDALKVEDSSYARLVTRCWLIAAISRIYNPGCKWDYALIIKGDQGIGKSTAFAKLGSNWFNDSIDSINGKDAVEQLIGSWIVELGEMQAAKKSTNEAIKSFISRRIDKVRLPYYHRSEEYPRQAVFAGTTNNEEFLKDLTGGRRFLILIALATDSEAKERLAAIDKAYIDQLWAEVLLLYKSLFKDGFDDTKLVPPSEVFEVAKKLQSDYTEGSELEGMIKAYLDILLPKDWNKMTMQARRNFIQTHTPGTSEDDSRDNDEFNPYENSPKGEVQRTVVSAVEIAYELFKIDNPCEKRSTLRQINDILARLEGWKRTTWKRCGVYGQQRVAFERGGSLNFAA